MIVEINHRTKLTIKVSRKDFLVIRLPYHRILALTIGYIYSYLLLKYDFPLIAMSDKNPKKIISTSALIKDFRIISLNTIKLVV